MEKNIISLPVTVDKSHLVTIGEQLYARSIELVREFVNNAYDADATEVRITADDERIVVWDNGSGMDYDGLVQYFSIGSPLKKKSKRSHKYHRELIGQFGIGKFAALTAGERFEVATQQGDFAAEAVFDKSQWQSAPREWSLPLTVHPADPSRGDGTTVTITRLKKRFSEEDLEKVVTESVPLRAPHFAVHLNGRRLAPREYVGQRIPFLEGTPHGVIHGEIVILPDSHSTAQELGIQVLVKGVLVRREMFGMETWGADATRIRGSVSADFLPITSDRSGFILDSPEYEAFFSAMGRVMEQVRHTLRVLGGKRETSRVKRALKEALLRIQEALARNPDLSPFGPVPYGAPGEAGSGPGVTAAEGAAGETGAEGPVVKKLKKEKKAKKQDTPAVNRLTPRAVVQKVKLGKMGITCCLDHFGPDSAECFTEGGVIYINQDHPLYEREVRKREAHVMHISRLLTQEISLMGEKSDPRKAFDLQSRLLKTAFQAEKEKK